MSRPYLIIPKLVRQPTWGGSYIAMLKKWSHLPHLQTPIGQSYELSGQSKLLLHAHTTEALSPELGSADSAEIDLEHFSYAPDEYVVLADLIEQNPDEVLGAAIAKKYGAMPLLIKLNQAAGNSFQIHVKPGTPHPRWLPKPESMYFFEDGVITCGLTPDCDVAAYEQCCRDIDVRMHSLSEAVVSGQLLLSEAREQAKAYIAEANPWQFVNRVVVKKGQVVDLSEGGVQHSWEEDLALAPLGNINFEVQLDAMDPVCTIRAFDQGKIKDDGTIRELNIHDFFTYLDTDPVANNPALHVCSVGAGHTLMNNTYYEVLRHEIEHKQSFTQDGSFHHIFVHHGLVEILHAQTVLHVGSGHSCFIPAGCKEYICRPIQGAATIFLTQAKTS